jgi:biopolymer transport protein TolR
MPKLEERQQTPGRHARRARSLRVSTTLAEINVVPLVDVMLVLLIIFMVTAPMMTQGFGVQLPRSTRSTAISAPLTVTVPLSFREEGNRVRVGEELVRLDFLATRVRAVLSDRLDKSVILAGDGAITLNEFMRVADKLREAGVEKVGLQTQPGQREPPR